MRRRLLASTLGIALLCVVALGVPLALLARHQVWTSARDRLREQAAAVASGLEDRIDGHQPLDLPRYIQLMPDRRLVVSPPHGRPRIVAGPALPDRPMSASVTVSDYEVTVEAARGPVVTRAREVTLIVVGLALLAGLAAVGFGLWQARRFARPVDRLVDRAEALGRGRFAATPMTSGVPEIDRISHVLERSARQIGTLVDLQRGFASDAAHQLRTPLTSIGLHLEEIGRVGAGRIANEADEALAQVERLNGVITSLLARARGDSAEPTLVDVASVAADSSVAWQRILANQQRALVVEADDTVEVWARREHLVSVLTSLLDNAVSHGAGTVTLSVRRNGETVRLSVRDEGPGVPEELAGDIFARRVSGSQGLGIGLALAHSLAAAEFGSLDLSSTDRAELVLTLPSAHVSPNANP